MNALTAFFSPYKLVIEIVVIGALVAFGVVEVHRFLEHERDIGRQEVQAKWDDQTKKDVAAARLREAELIKQRDDAITNGAKRDETIRTLATSASTASSGLRDTITAAVGRVVSGVSDNAVRDITRTLGASLAECSIRRLEVAKDFEHANSDKQTLIDAWPRNPDPTTKAQQ